MAADSTKPPTGTSRKVGEHKRHGGVLAGLYFGFLGLLSPQRLHKGAGPKSSCRFSKLLPCLNKQRKQVEDGTRESTCRQRHKVSGQRSPVFRESYCLALVLDPLGAGSEIA